MNDQTSPADLKNAEVYYEDSAASWCNGLRHPHIKKVDQLIDWKGNDICHPSPEWAAWNKMLFKGRFDPNQFQLAIDFIETKILEEISLV